MNILGDLDKYLTELGDKGISRSSFISLLSAQYIHYLMSIDKKDINKEQLILKDRLSSEIMTYGLDYTLDNIAEFEQNEVDYQVTMDYEGIAYVIEDYLEFISEFRKDRTKFTFPRHY